MAAFTTWVDAGFLDFIVPGLWHLALT